MGMIMNQLRLRHTYVDHQNETGKSVAVNSCGLSVHPSMPWLAASPDGILQKSFIREGA